MFIWLTSTPIRKHSVFGLTNCDLSITFYSSQTNSNHLNSITATMPTLLEVHCPLLPFSLYIRIHVDMLISQGKFCHYEVLETEINPLQIFWSISWPILKKKNQVPQPSWKSISIIIRCGDKQNIYLLNYLDRLFLDFSYV